MYGPSWDAGEWDDFWDSTDHDITEFEATPPEPCKHSAIRKAVLTEHSGRIDPVVWAWVCRFCGAPLYEVPEVAE